MGERWSVHARENAQHATGALTAHAHLRRSAVTPRRRRSREAHAHGLRRRHHIHARTRHTAQRCVELNRRQPARRVLRRNQVRSAQCHVHTARPRQHVRRRHSRERGRVEGHVDGVRQHAHCALDAHAQESDARRSGELELGLGPGEVVDGRCAACCVLRVHYGDVRRLHAEAIRNHTDCPKPAGAGSAQCYHTRHNRSANARENAQHATGALTAHAHLRRSAVTPRRRRSREAHAHGLRRRHHIHARTRHTAQRCVELNRRQPARRVLRRNQVRSAQCHVHTARPRQHVRRRHSRERGRVEGHVDGVRQHAHCALDAHAQESDARRSGELELGLGPGEVVDGRCAACCVLRVHYGDVRRLHAEAVRNHAHGGATPCAQPSQRQSRRHGGHRHTCEQSPHLAGTLAARGHLHT